jgi:hypothetical protein
MHIDFEVPEEILHHLLDPVPLPTMARIRYDMETPPAVRDLAGSVTAELRKPDVRSAIQAGQRIAIGVGSRGIDRLPEIVAAVVSEVRSLGADPFIIPTMGSHGGATAGGQIEVLEHLGVTEMSVGAPIESQMATEEIGRTPDGMPVYTDRLALRADGIVLIARVKPHTAFHGTYESGMAKMIAIGLGKQAGAASTHAHGFGEMARMVPAMARVALERAPIRFVVAIIEKAHDKASKIVAVPAGKVLEIEPELLEEARRNMARIPFAQLDVLVIDEIGKNISGDGADPNITGRFPTPFAEGEPNVDTQVVLDLTSASGGNAMGVGTADIMTVRLARKMSLAATYSNALTSTTLGPVKVPMVLPSDRLALAAAILTCHAVGRAPRLMRIKNTLALEEFWVSEALLDEVREDPTQQISAGPKPMEFDNEGNLPDLSHAPSTASIASAQQPDAW